MTMKEGAQAAAVAKGQEGTDVGAKAPRVSSRPVPMLDVEQPWSHEKRKLGVLYMEASPERREAARQAYRGRGGYEGRLLEALPLGIARLAFEAGWLDLEDSGWAARAGRFDLPLADLFASQRAAYIKSASRNPVAMDASKYTLVERIALVALLESWDSGMGWPGTLSPAQFVGLALARDPALSASVDKVAVDFGVAAAKRADMDKLQGDDLTARVRQMRTAFGQLGVSPEAMAKAAAGLAVFTKSKVVRDMLAGAPGPQEAAERPGQLGWMQALRGAVGVDDARVAMLVVEAARADGLDLLGVGCRWKNASAMRTALGLACELGSIQCALAFGENGAASGVVILDGCLLDSANPLISLADKCLAGYLHPKNGVDAKLWGKAFAGVFAAIGREIEAQPGSRGMMEAMGKKLETRPAELKKLWDEGRGQWTTNLGPYATAPLLPTAVAAATALLERALMTEMHVGEAPLPAAPGQGRARL